MAVDPRLKALQRRADALRERSKQLLEETERLRLECLRLREWMREDARRGWRLRESRHGTAG